jgi:fucose 4-O-acetylase-like acetyltransferase
LGLNNFVGIITRAMTLFVGLMMTAALFKILPDRQTKLAAIGRNSLVVYIGHFYIAYYFHNMFYDLTELNILLLGSFLIFITIIFLSLNSISNIYNKLMNNIINIIFIKSTVN